MDDVATPEPNRVEDAAPASAPRWDNPGEDPGDGFCWVCGAPVIDRHCKIVCPRCGFMRDCSDP